MKAFWIGLATIVAATSPAVIFSRKPDVPYYWSGTNCRGIGSPAGYDTRGANPEKGIAEYKIEINGTEVFSQPHLMPGDWFRAGGGSVIFDSSHFANGTTVEVKSFAKAIHVDGTIDANWTDDGGYSAMVVNKANIYAQPIRENVNPADTIAFSLTGVAPLVNNLMTSGNYGTNMINGSGWGRTSLNNSLAGTNTLFVFAHGNPGVHETATSPQPGVHENSCQGQSGTYPDGVTVEGYLNVRQDQVGTLVLPPFNPSANPPINLFFLYSCHTGQGDFWKALFPFENIYSYGAVEDQAWISFNRYVSIPHGYEVTSAVMSRLMTTWTISDAVSYLLTQNIACVTDDLPDGKPSPYWRSPTLEDITLLGDAHTRIRGAYKPTSGTSTSWYL